MSVYYSRFGLNTYCGTPYFQSQIPNGYDCQMVMRKCRAFRRLPKHLQELARLSKRWAEKHSPEDVSESQRYYDANGNELDPSDGHKLTDAEIDAQWVPDPSLDRFVVQDLPVPAGGFADPDAWEKPEGKTEEDRDRPSKFQLLKDVQLRGAETVARTYGLDANDVNSLTQNSFAKRAVRAASSSGLTQSEAAYLSEALQGADIYEDLGGYAQELFDKAEASYKPSVNELNEIVNP